MIYWSCRENKCARYFILNSMKLLLFHRISVGEGVIQWSNWVIGDLLSSSPSVSSRR